MIEGIQPNASFSAAADAQFAEFLHFSPFLLIIFTFFSVIFISAFEKPSFLRLPALFSRHFIAFLRFLNYSLLSYPFAHAYSNHFNVYPRHFTVFLRFFSSQILRLQTFLRLPAVFHVISLHIYFISLLCVCTRLFESFSHLPSVWHVIFVHFHAFYILISYYHAFAHAYSYVYLPCFTSFHYIPPFFTSVRSYFIYSLANLYSNYFYFYHVISMFYFYSLRSYFISAFAQAYSNHFYVYLLCFT